MTEAKPVSDWTAEDYDREVLRLRRAQGLSDAIIGPDVLAKLAPLVRAMNGKPAQAERMQDRYSVSELEVLDRLVGLESEVGRLIRLLRNR